MSKNLILKIAFWCILLTSCSSKFHYFISASRFSSGQPALDFNGKKSTSVKALGIDTLANFDERSCDDSVFLTIKDTVMVHVLKKSEDCLKDVICIYGLRVSLTELWKDDNYKSVDDSVNWSLESAFLIKTINRSYIYLVASNDITYHVKYYYPMIVDVSTSDSLAIFTLPLSLDFFPGEIEDLDNDGELEFIGINDSIERLEIYHITNRRIVKDTSVYVELKSTKALDTPYYCFYKTRHVQRKLGWLRKNKFIFSFKFK